MKITPNIRNNSMNYSKSQAAGQSQFNPSSKMAQDSVSFGSLKTGVAKLFDVMGANFFIEFLIVDSLSMMVPRTLIGLNRDKDKTGKVNYKAGIEEAGRELISGPSMNIIPMAFLLFVRNKCPASHMQTDLLKGFNHNFNQVINNQTDINAFQDKSKFCKELADQFFEDAFANHKFANKEELKTTFSKLLLDSQTVKPSLLFQNKAYKAKLTEFETHIAKIYNSNKNATPESTQILNITTKIQDGKPSKTRVGAHDFFSAFHDYSKDVVSKITKQNIAEKTLGSVKTRSIEFVKSHAKTSSNIKLTTAIAAFFAVGAFLLYLPKLYQQGKVSPAMESAKRAQAEVGGSDENK